MTQSFDSDSAPAPVGAYPHARRAGDLLFLSGLGPRTPGSNDIPGNEYDGHGRLVAWNITAQTRQLIANLEAVLKDAGAGLDRLVDVTVFLTDMQRDFPAFNAVYAELLGAHRPCRTTVEIGALPTPIAVEFKCIAWVGDRGNQAG